MSKASWSARILSWPSGMLALVKAAAVFSRAIPAPMERASADRAGSDGARALPGELRGRAPESSVLARPEGPRFAARATTACGRRAEFAGVISTD